MNSYNNIIILPPNYRGQNDRREVNKLTLTKDGWKRTKARLLRISTTASRIPGRRLTPFSTEAAQAEHVIPVTEKRALTSDPSTVVLLLPSSVVTPFGYVGMDG